MAATAIVPGLKPEGGRANTLQLSVFYVALYVVAFGTGGIKPNVSAFGADQFDDKVKRERLDKQSFFNWFYFFINVGSLIACTLIVWIQARLEGGVSGCSAHRKRGAVSHRRSDALART